MPSIIFAWWKWHWACGRRYFFLMTPEENNFCGSIKVQVGFCDPTEKVVGDFDDFMVIEQWNWIIGSCRIQTHLFPISKYYWIECVKGRIVGQKWPRPHSAHTWKLACIAYSQQTRMLKIQILFTYDTWLNKLVSSLSSVYLFRQRQIE